MRWHQAVKDVWQTEFEEVRHRARFLVLLSFLLTFGVVRLITYGIREQWGGFLHNLVTPGGVHLHHMIFGIALLLAVGYIALAAPKEAWRLWLAVAYGVGAALTLDEFALWFNLADVYWSRAGRLSVDVVIITATVLALAWVGSGFWRGLVQLTVRTVRRRSPTGPVRTPSDREQRAAPKDPG